MKLTIFLILLILICPVIATSSDLRISGSVVAGAVTDHSIIESTISSDNAGFLTGGDNWNYQNTARRVTTLGYTKSTTDDRANARVDNIVTASTNLTGEETGIAETGYYLEDNKVNIPEEVCTGGQTTPDIMSAEGQTIEGQYPSHQEVDVTHTMLFGYGDAKFDSTGSLNDVNATTSINAEGNAGSATLRYRVHDEAGFNQSSADKNYDSDTRRRVIANDFNQSGYSMAYDITHTNHDRPFETLVNASRLSTNKTADADILSSNETNLTD